MGRGCKESAKSKNGNGLEKLEKEEDKQ